MICSLPQLLFWWSNCKSRENWILTKFVVLSMHMTNVWSLWTEKSSTCMCKGEDASGSCRKSAMNIRLNHLHATVQLTCIVPHANILWGHRWALCMTSSKSHLIGSVTLSSKWKKGADLQKSNTAWFVQMRRCCGVTDSEYSFPGKFRYTSISIVMIV